MEKLPQVSFKRLSTWFSRQVGKNTVEQSDIDKIRIAETFIEVPSPTSTPFTTDGLIEMLKDTLRGSQNITLELTEHEAVSGHESSTLSNKEFFRRIGTILPRPARFFYPGWGEDNILEDEFKREELFYLDRRPDIPDTDGGLFYRGDYSQVLFPEGFFDALLYRDNHASMAEFRRMLRSLRIGGFVVYQTLTCRDEIEPVEIESMPELRRLALPFRHNYFWVFEKQSEPSKT